MHSSLTFTLSLILSVHVYGVAGAAWGYNYKNGPQTWTGACQTGLRQTPIDIRTMDTDYSLMDRVNFIGYDQLNEVTAVNNGHTVSAAGFTEWKNKPYISGGALEGKYYLQQFHLHWGQKDHVGSEHKIGGLSYPAELHLVHLKEGLTLAEALTRGDGLAVVGVFLNIGESGEPLAALTKNLEELTYSGNMTQIDKFRPRSVLPTVTDAFYRYEGSLTTPGCNEAVQWILLAEPISVTRDQMEQLRKIRNTEGEEHEFNFRPTFPLNGRRVRFRPAQYDRLRFCSSSYFPSLFITVFSIILSKILN
ncbi:hypothetical protein PFISCL1PPCAC_24120 [Pristionchus fissidentatus]|uniref:Carbonic anhydrase n=1 Tax=Pristionchus fissidentatus TaxID=1538716 RepID=A0AAV5WN66_9BILA|nr:hypothetical protein PFISCL1PPCAC_24120 [Pristionchus fissidentatus]